MSTTHREGASRGHGMKPWAKRVLVQIAEFHLNRRRVMPKHSFSDLHLRQEKSGSATCSSLSADKKLQALKVCLSEVMCVFAPHKKNHGIVAKQHVMWHHHASERGLEHLGSMHHELVPKIREIGLYFFGCFVLFIKQAARNL